MILKPLQQRVNLTGILQFLLKAATTFHLVKLCKKGQQFLPKLWFTHDKAILLEKRKVHSFAHKKIEQQKCSHYEKLHNANLGCDQLHFVGLRYERQARNRLAINAPKVLRGAGACVCALCALRNAANPSAAPFFSPHAFDTASAGG
jgi:hypothetical protein